MYKLRRIRFLTDANIVIWIETEVVLFVVLAVVLRVVDALNQDFSFLGNRVISAASPWVTPEYASQ